MPNQNRAAKRVKRQREASVRDLPGLYHPLGHPTPLFTVKP